MRQPFYACPKHERGRSPVEHPQGAEDMNDDTDIVQRVNDLTEMFERETGIWPPGRDRPAAFGGEDIEQVRLQAWDYWLKTRRQLAQANKENKRLRGIIDGLPISIPGRTVADGPIYAVTTLGALLDAAEAAKAPQ